MHFNASRILAAILGSLAGLNAMADSAASVSLEDYRRAEALRPARLAPLALNLSVTPIWVPRTEVFWFRQQDAQGWRYVAIDADKRARGVPFDHARLAAAIGAATHETVDVHQLPLENLAIEDDAAQRITFDAKNGRIACDLQAFICRIQAPATVRPTEIVSPDGSLAIRVKDDNLWLHNLSSGDERALTQDGEPHFSYGKMPDGGLLSILKQSAGLTFPPYGIEWSPDSRKLIVSRLDERAIADYYFLQSVPYDGTLRPKVFSLRTPLSGESLKATPEVAIIDVASGARVRLAVGAEGLSKSLWWAPDNRHFLALQGGDYSRQEVLFDIDATTGALRRVLQEDSATFLQVSPLEYDEPALRYLPRTNEFIWYSQRDGWNHLYLVDLKTGAIKAELGKGAWSVQNIIYVDEPHRRLYFTAVGREPGEDPYYRHLYSVRFDGRDLKLLTPEPADHDIPGLANPALADVMTALGLKPSPPRHMFSPSARYFIDTWSTVESPPVTVLRSADGRIVMPLAKTNIEAAVAAGWIAPQSFHSQAKDGSELYGILFKPHGFDASKPYPVLECIYNGPQVVTTPHDFEGGLSDWMAGCAQSFAQLGFVTLVMDGRGTPLRSKAFQDYMYNNMQEFALEDHVTVIKALAAERPYMDLDRLGVIGHSFGGYTAMKAILGYPDFYKAAVASAGPYDMYGMYPLDAFFKPPVLSAGDARTPPLPTNWGQVDLTLQADRLNGKLLIAYGDLDENAFPAITARMVNALTAANKEFDLIYMPNRSHAFSDEPYFIRRSWDFFVRHLLNAEPPKDYRFQTAP